MQGGLLERNMLQVEPSSQVGMENKNIQSRYPDGNLIKMSNGKSIANEHVHEFWKFVQIW